MDLGSSAVKRYFVASAPYSRDIYVMVLYVMVLYVIVPNSIVKQESIQAAENKSPPPVSASRLKADTLEVAYTMGVQDWISAYRTGISHFRRISFGLFAGLLIVVVCSLVAALVFYDGYIHAWQCQHSFPWHYVHIMLISFAVGPVAFILLMSLMFWSGATRKLTLQDLGIVISLKSGRSVVLWRHATNVLEQGEYIAICYSNPAALIIPHGAFPNEQAAKSFHTAALAYWRKAKGLPEPPVPETAGVWPPAPRPGNSAEPGDSPQC